MNRPLLASVSALALIAASSTRAQQYPAPSTLTGTEVQLCIQPPPGTSGAADKACTVNLTSAFAQTNLSSSNSPVIASLSTAISTGGPGVASLSTSTSTGISTNASGLASLSTGLSTTISGVSSLSTSVSTGIVTGYLSTSGAITSTQTLSGTKTVSSVYPQFANNYLGQLQDVEDSATATDGAAGFITSTLYRCGLNAGFAGNRQCFATLLDIEGAPSSGNLGGNWISFYPTLYANVNLGGTSGTPKGAIFAENPVCTAGANATYLLEVTCAEVNFAMVTGSSALYKYGWTIVANTNDQVSGSVGDGDIELTSQSSLGVQVGIDFTNYSGYYPLKSTGTMMKAEGGSFKDGLDVSLATLSGYAVRMANGQAIQLGTGGSIGYNGYIQPAGFIRPPEMLVANISANDPTPVASDLVTVSDASACTPGTPVTTGGGSTYCPLVYYSSNWYPAVPGSAGGTSVASLSTSTSTGISTNASGLASLSTGLSTTNSSVGSLSTSASSGISTAQSGVVSLSTGLSTNTSQITSLSTGLSSANSGVNSVSTGLSTTNSSVASLSTAVSSSLPGYNSTQTLSTAGASIQWTGLGSYSSTYTTGTLTCHNLVATASNGYFMVQVGTGAGPTWITAGQYVVQGTDTTAGSTTIVNASADVGVALNNTLMNTSASATGAQFTDNISNLSYPSSQNAVFTEAGTYQSSNSTTSLHQATLAGNPLAGAAVTAIRVVESTSLTTYTSANFTGTCNLTLNP